MERPNDAGRQTTGHKDWWRDQESFNFEMGMVTLSEESMVK